MNNSLGISFFPFSELLNWSNNLFNVCSCYKKQNINLDIKIYHVITMDKTNFNSWLSSKAAFKCCDVNTIDREALFWNRAVALGCFLLECGSRWTSVIYI